MLNEARARRLLGLVADLRHVPAQREEQLQHLLRGLLDVVGAPVALLLEDQDFRPGGRGRVTEVTDVGMDDYARRVAWPLYAQLGSAWDPAVAQMMKAGNASLAVRRQDIVTDHDWYDSGYVADLRRTIRLDHVMYSLVPGRRPAAVRVLAVNRAWGERAFNRQDLRLLRAFHEACAWLHDSPADELGGMNRPLPARLARVLTELLRAKSDKEIALTLGLSTHTVRGYVKEVYRSVGVTSRAELVVRFHGRRRSSRQS